MARESCSSEAQSSLQSLIYAQVKALVEWRGIDINRRDYDGRTALLVAASEGRLDVVQYLGM